ncbi:MAG: nucleotidyltransferase [Planctomycetota bacterium]|nr:nucleotidyltransferase [Planctomycetota bacterium]
MNSRNEQDPAVDLRVTTTLSRVVDVLSAHGVQYALIGGLGVALRGNVRATQDVDILMHVVQLRLPSVLEAIRDCGCQLDVVAAIREWNDNGMLAVQSPEGVQVDLLKPVIPVFHRIIERASDEAFNQQVVRVADAESLLLLKLLAFRPLDQEDIRGILTKNVGGLDLDWVRKEAGEAGLDQQRLDNFEQLVKDFYQG